MLRRTKPTSFAGDDSGVIKLWDSRQSDAVASLEAHDDFVSDLALHERESCLLSVSGDGTLAVTDLRTNKVRGLWWEKVPRNGIYHQTHRGMHVALVCLVSTRGLVIVCRAVKL